MSGNSRPTSDPWTGLTRANSSMKYLCCYRLPFSQGITKTGSLSHQGISLNAGIWQVQPWVRSPDGVAIVPPCIWSGGTEGAGRLQQIIGLQSVGTRLKHVAHTLGASTQQSVYMTQCERSSMRLLCLLSPCGFIMNSLIFSSVR